MFGIGKKIDDLRRKCVYTAPLNICSRWIKICSPSYVNEGFIGTLEVDVSHLPGWIGSRFDYIINSGPPYHPNQLAAEFMIPWFKNANLKNESITTLDEFQRIHLKDFALDFMRKKIARIYCPSCREYYLSINEKTLNKKVQGPWTFWTSEWYCDKGHLLYQYNHELHQCK